MFPGCDVQIQELMNALATLVNKASHTVVKTNVQAKTNNIRAQWHMDNVRYLIASPGLLLANEGRKMAKTIDVRERDARGKQVVVQEKRTCLVEPSVPINRQLMINSEVDTAEKVRKHFNFQKMISSYLEVTPFRLHDVTELVESVLQEMYTIGDHMKHVMKNRKTKIRAACLARMQHEPVPDKPQKGQKGKEKIPQLMWIEESEKLKAMLERMDNQDEGSIPDDLDSYLQQKFSTTVQDFEGMKNPDQHVLVWISEL
jgi:hypothetical protein